MMAALLWARLIFLSALAGIVGLCVWTAYRTNERERARGQTRQKGVNSQFSTPASAKATARRPNSQRAQSRSSRNLLGVEGWELGVVKDVFFRTRTNEGRER